MGRESEPRRSHLRPPALLIPRPRVPHSAVREASFRDSDRWLRLLELKGVQILHLDFHRSHRGLVVPTLDPTIFSCRELTSLYLRGCDVPTTPPGFAGLPNLTSLRLSNVGFPEGARELQLLIATSPMLEALSHCCGFLIVMTGMVIGLFRLPNFVSFI